MAASAVTHDVDRAAHLVVQTTVVASMLTLHAASALVERLGIRRRSHFEEICSAYADLVQGEAPEYLNSRL